MANDPWISVKVGLPTYRQEVLIWYVGMKSHGRARMAHLEEYSYEPEGWRWQDSGWIDNDKVTHWMPLPGKPHEPMQDSLGEVLLPFVKSARDNWDCDTGANGSHPHYCRVCEAKNLLEKYAPGS